MINMDARTFLPETSPTSPSVITLMEKAADCLEIARTQHEAADQQHLDADKLDEIGYALEVSAVEMEGKTVLAGRVRREHPLGEDFEKDGKQSA